MKVLFIHRSVGAHLLKYGDLRSKLNAKDIQLDDYNNNVGILTRNDGSIDNSAITIPGNNTNPNNLEAFFSNWSKVIDNYDLVIIKSCYPNSNIKSTNQLNEIKGQYIKIIKYFKDHKKKLLIFTTPPLRPITTSPVAAKRATELADWLVSQANNNVHIFDFRKLLVNDRGMLMAKYRHWSMPWDNHPKRFAHKSISPQLVDFIVHIKV